MEVPVLNRIAELGSDLGLLRIFTSFSPSPHFWKWGAVLITLLATFSGIINRLKILIIVIRRRSRTTPISEPLSRSLHGGETAGLVSENLRSSLLSSLESANEKEADREPDDGSDFRVKGTARCSRLRRRYGGGSDGDSVPWSWPCFGSERSVVRQWVDVKFKCEFEKLSGSVISLYDENEEAEICSILSDGAPLQVAALSPGRMVVAAGESVSSNVSLKLWDTRCRSRTSVLAAEWNSPSGKVVDVYSDDVDKIYLIDNGGDRIVVGDVRKVRSVSENSSAVDNGGWWESEHRRRL
ncbi:uncharacterized protein LOC111489361 [Cucurbita maxima]|uniref:Uncharacterized protein LOC111489361 n=1 Tax=Cucurbita maxima TaxID=3661 RepID=A0A6J1K1V4_CUCMA|nr:uncharacterized protein LOC111489361 [Cucurbita maxima]